MLLWKNSSTATHVEDSNKLDWLGEAEREMFTVEKFVGVDA